MNHLLAKAPPDLAGGRVPAPAWLILTVAGVVIVAVLGVLAARFLRASKDKR